MRTTCIVLLAVAAAWGIAVHRAGRDQASAINQVRTFAAADGSFTFDYSQDLVDCKPDARNEKVWIPAPSCDALCWDPLGQDFKTLACVAFPREPYKGYNFDAAAFSVIRVPSANTSSKCMNDALPDRGSWFDTSFRKVNGTRFRMVHSSGAGAMHTAEMYRFRNFHHGYCYQLQITMVTTAFGVYPAGAVKRFTPTDREKVLAALMSVLDSFRLKR